MTSELTGVVRGRRVRARSAPHVAPGTVPAARPAPAPPGAGRGAAHPARITAASVGAYQAHNHVIVSLDQLARNIELQDKLCAAGWDLAVFDEAHKLAAHFFGTKLEKTGGFRFA